MWPLRSGYYKSVEIDAQKKMLGIKTLKWTTVEAQRLQAALKFWKVW